MRSVVGIGLFAVGCLAGLAMIIAEFSWFYAWWGLIGLAAAVFLFPAIFVFPFVFWIKCGISPVLYVILWAISIVGVAAGAALKGE